jgi:hypothetical protein
MGLEPTGLSAENSQTGHLEVLQWAQANGCDRDTCFLSHEQARHGLVL